MARLILTTAEGQQAIDLRPVNSLGRHPNNSIQLLDKIVSKEHCIIERRDNSFWLRDLGSLNGTFINNERVRGEAPLKHGDEIALGATRGRFDEGAGAAEEQSAAPASPGPYAPPAGASPLAQSSHQMVAPAYAKPGPFRGQASFAPPSQVPSTQGTPQHPPYPHPGSAPPLVGFAPPAGAPMIPPGPSGTAPLQHPRGAVPGANTSFLAQGTRIDLNDQARQIGTQINAVEKGFLPFERISNDLNQLRADYERLRLAHELSHEIGIERDIDRLLDKILQSVFKFITADRAVIFLRDHTGELTPRAFQRRDGTTAPITVSSTILSHVVNERAAVLTHDAAMDFAASKGKSMILNRISSAIVAPLLQHDNDVLGVLWLDSETLARFQPKDLELVQTVANQAARFIEILILGKKVEEEIITRERFSRLLSPNIAERVISGQLEVKQGGQRVQECTVFNSDIRGFTRMSEGTNPEVLVEMLNEYFELMVDTIFKYEGTLDKFMGDGIMALWGAPVQSPGDAPRSVECAMEMAEVLGKFNRRRIEAKQSPLAIGVGIHTGPLVAGYIGSSKALSYTVVGDVANTSARICSVALPGQVIVSEFTLAKLGQRFEVEELQPARVKGKEKPLRIYNVLRMRAAAQVPDQVFGSEPTTAASS
jgi:adenylate cyclase